MTAAVAMARPSAPHPVSTLRPRPEEEGEPERRVIRIRPALGASGPPPRSGPRPDPVEIAAIESFPASDPPSWTGATVR